MGRMYSVPFTAQAVTTANDLFEITAASGKPCIVHSIEVEQYTEVGDAQEEGLSLTLRRGTSLTTSGSGGSSVTPVAQISSDASAGFAAEVNNSTVMAVGTGTITTLRAWSWNVRIPFNKVFTPDTAPVIAGGERLVLRLEGAPADSITMNGTIMVEEVG